MNAYLTCMQSQHFEMTLYNGTGTGLRACVVAMANNGNGNVEVQDYLIAAHLTSGFVTGGYLYFTRMAHLLIHS